MISKRRLLAGLTSFTSNLWLDHFSAIGPSGILASSSPYLVTTPVVMSDGMAMFPTVMSTANPTAK